MKLWLTVFCNVTVMLILINWKNTLHSYVFILSNGPPLRAPWGKDLLWCSPEQSCPPHCSKTELCVIPEPTREAFWGFPVVLHYTFRKPEVLFLTTFGSLRRLPVRSCCWVTLHAWSFVPSVLSKAHHYSFPNSLILSWKHEIHPIKDIGDSCLF